MPRLTIGEVLERLNGFDDGDTVEFLTMDDAIARLQEDDVAPRYLDGTFGSYRGYYDELHIGYSPREDKGLNTVGSLKEILRDALTQGVMYGYKGGEFPITVHTPVWLAMDISDCSRMYLQDVRQLTPNVATILLGEDDY